MFENSLHCLAIIGAIGRNGRVRLFLAAALPFAGRTGLVRSALLAGGFFATRFFATAVLITGLLTFPLLRLLLARLPATRPVSLRTGALPLIGALPLVLTRALFASALALSGCLLLAPLLASLGRTALVALLRCTLRSVLLVLLFRLLFLLSLLLRFALGLLLIRRLLIFKRLLLAVGRIRGGILFLASLLIVVASDAFAPWVAFPLLLLSFTGLFAGLFTLLTTRLRRRFLGHPRRRAGVDLQRLPGRIGNIRRLRPRVDGHGPVFEHAARFRPQPLRHEPQGSLENAGPLLGEQCDLGLERSALQPSFDADACQCEVGIECPHPNGDGRRRWHPGRRFPRLLDRHLGSKIRDHLDPMLHRLDDLRFTARRRRRPRPKEQAIDRVFGAGTVGIHLQRKRPRHPRQVVRLLREFQVMIAVAVKIQPRILEGLVALGDDGHLRALEGADVSLPLDNFALLPRIRWKVVPHLANEQRRRVDNGDSHRLAPGIAGPNHDLDGVIEAAGTVGKHRRKPPARTGVGGPIQPGGSPSANHLHLPRCGRRAGGQSRGTIGHAAGRRRRHCHQRLLVAAQSADVGRHHELPSAHERGGGPIDRKATTIESADTHAGIHAVLFARHSPGKFR